MTKAVREWMLCSSERRNTEFGGRKGGAGSVRGRKTSLQDKAQNLKKSSVSLKEVDTWKLRRRWTLNRVCLNGCLSEILSFFLFLFITTCSV
jgi:hypothetical protein